MTNPFRQPKSLTRLSFTVPNALVTPLELMFEDSALTVAGFEVDDHTTTVEMLFEQAPSDAEITRRIALAQEVAEAKIPWPDIVAMEQKDWVSEVQKSFPPLNVAQFYVHGSHVTEAPPVSAIALHVDAGNAFGSGEHATTSTCLEALSRLAKKRTFRRVLDMGAGSGILAMAAAKLIKCDALAVDIDEVSVKVAAENIEKNRVAQYVTSRLGDGYKAAFVKRGAPYDLIFANILARPLVKFAPSLARALAPGGVAILSGLLESQATMVLAAHRAQGLRLIQKIPRNGWMALVLQKGGR